MSATDYQRPSHQVHNSSDPIPGTKGSAGPSADYSAQTIERQPSSAFKDLPGTPNEQPSTGFQRTGSASGNTAYNSERPLDTRPTEQGGVAIGGRDDLPEGKAGFGDKLIGKAQKVVGKTTHKPELHEKGELREAGGKAAARGDARAPHD
ncbi:hypothetical protein PLICRDRAFT_108103 [Plicaturopsis crispa FD-325 SS-3]|nr:hypothetical protein PLICRDRAFT_108103 [Plicaturopsis crispa FD-325 SS-3]